MAIPKPAAERLSQLARLLEQSTRPDKPVSSTELEQLTGWSSHTIRKDISALESNADFSTTAGYTPAALVAAIREKLGYTDELSKCCIVGLGQLGTAFLNYPAFNGSPYTLCAGFDSNVNRIEILKAPFPLFPAYRMKEQIPRLGITFAILCVPGEQAQSTADKLVECGIRGIVNFTTSILTVPAGVEVENVSLVDALGLLAARLAIHTVKSNPTRSET